MRLSVSNIAWDPDEDDAVAALLVEAGVDAIDVAPSKLFASVSDAHPREAEAVRARWAARGLQIAGMQSLLYGTQGLDMFGPADVQAKMLAHLDQVCLLAAKLDCPTLTFGSPKNRRPGALSPAAAWQAGSDFFCRLADVAASHGVVMCLEANPVAYGCSFLTTTPQAAAMVLAVDHPNLRLQLDFGTCSVNEEDAAEVVARHGHLVGHVHISEPQLQPVRAQKAHHAAYADALARYLPEKVATLEMLVPQGSERLQTLRVAIDGASARYRHPSPPDASGAAVGRATPRRPSPAASTP